MPQMPETTFKFGSGHKMMRASATIFLLKSEKSPVQILQTNLVYRRSPTKESFSLSQLRSGLGNSDDKEKSVTRELSFCLSVIGLTCCPQDLMFVAGHYQEAAITVLVETVTQLRIAGVCYVSLQWYLYCPPVIKTVVPI